MLSPIFDYRLPQPPVLSVPQRYILSRFSSWSFRLSVSVALLVGSAALAASLLVDAAIGTARPLSLSWQPSARPAHAASQLQQPPPAGTPPLPASLSSLVPSYSFAAGGSAAASPASAAKTQLTGPAADDILPAISDSASLKATVQRSWRTFKLAFR
jgi:hypothetical protein